MDDYFENFDDDSFDEGAFGEESPEIDEDHGFEGVDGSQGGIDWQDWMIIGPLSEEIARERREQERLERENADDTDKDY